MPLTNESVTSAGKPVRVDVYSPATPGMHAAVLILHGTLGLEAPFGADIVSFAEALNTKGIAAAIPRYFDSTGTHAGDEALQSILVHLLAWKAACGAALAFMTADARFDATRMGAIGFSLGGHLALSLAMEPPAGTNFKGVVDFFGPTLAPELKGNWSALPPVLIHHGTADPLSIENSRHVVQKLGEVGRKVSPEVLGKPVVAPAYDDRFIEYPGEGHGFKGAALAASRESTVQFLDARLK